MVTVEQFTEGLSRSGLMTAEEVEAFLVTLPPEMHPPTVKALAAELVRRGMLTKYQVGRIAMGRPEGLLLGKYVIQEKIGGGGMGEVFAAEHRRMKRPVVVKVLPEAATQSKYSIRRFEREVEAAAKLQHPNIVTAFDADEEDGIYFLVMEYVEGETLGSLVSRCGPLSLEQGLSCAVQAAQGLQYAHSQGVIHRDVKPNNLLLDKSGKLKILDMGLARFDDATATIPLEDADSASQANQIVGTVDYMSPEQVEDSSKVDRRSDIYSLGCTLYRLLTSHPPYRRDSVLKTLLAHRNEPIPSICGERPDAPALLEQILQKMLAKVPEDRYQTVAELAEDLQACLDLVRRWWPSSEAFAGSGEHDAAEADTKILEPDVQHQALQGARGVVDPNVEVLVDDDTRTDIELAGSAAALAAAAQTTAVGIDLGTTFSAIASLDDAGQPRLLANIEGDKTTPSVVLLAEHEVIVGKEAVKAMSTDMQCIAQCAKRDLGHPLYHQRVGGCEFPPEVIQAWVLDKLRRDAAQRIGSSAKAVVTVPAYFDEVRRKATQDAAYLAGLELLDIINEPAAAALAFGFQHGHLDFSKQADPKRVLVYDLGGGTFDVTIMEIGSGEFVTLATDGDVELGGRDWDQRMVDYVADRFRQKHGIDPREDPDTYGRLLRECEGAKRALSVRCRAGVACEYRAAAERVEITRAAFEDTTRDLLDRTALATRSTLQSAGLGWEDIDHILLAGGSTRMPAVVQMLKRLSGRVPESSVSPEEAVAQGAAIHAALMLEKIRGGAPRVRVRNVNSHSLGVVGTERRTSRRQTAVLIPRNTPLPAKAERVFKTLKRGQKSVMISIVEGESGDPDECTQIGKWTVRDLPANLPAGTPVEVRFQYEENGRLQVTVNVGGVEKDITQEIHRANNLSPESLEQWRRWLASRKLRVD